MTLGKKPFTRLCPVGNRDDGGDLSCLGGTEGGERWAQGVRVRSERHSAGPTQKAERRAGRILSDPASSPLVEKTKLSAQKDSVLLPLGAAAGQVQGSRRLGLEPGPAA